MHDWVAVLSPLLELPPGPSANAKQLTFPTGLRSLLFAGHFELKPRIQAEHCDEGGKEPNLFMPIPKRDSVGDSGMEPKLALGLERRAQRISAGRKRRPCQPQGL